VMMGRGRERGWREGSGVFKRDASSR
jgi:hypothetical protein